MENCPFKAAKWKRLLQTGKCKSWVRPINNSNISVMKKIPISIILCILFVGSCTKEESIRDNDQVLSALILSEESKDQVISELSQVLSLSLKEVNVRYFLHGEIAKQFTLDYDITYELIKNKPVTSEKYGTIEFGKLLEKVAKDNSLDISHFLKYHEAFRNLQISSPVFFENWMPDNLSPMVISLPQDYDEGEGTKVRAYLSDGNYKMVLEEEIGEPILLVRESERVDNNGMIRVDIDGFVIPEGERYLTAARAYEIANSNGSGLKSAEVSKHEPVIVVVDDIDEIGISDNTCFIDSKNEIGIFQAESAASGIGIPTNPSALPNSSCCIQVKWGGVTGAVSYEIFRQFGNFSNDKIATVNNTQNIYSDKNLKNGTRYCYSIRSVDSVGNVSGLTYPVDAIASWRTNRTYEKIIKIFVDRDCWNKAICGTFDGKIELQYKLVLFNRENKSIESLPAGAVGALTQQSRNDQRDTWCTYNQNLFLWDLQTYAYSYGIYFVEDDGNGTSVTVELSANLKVDLAESASGQVSASIKFNIAAKDDQIGSMVVHYDTEAETEFVITPLEKNQVGKFKVKFGQ